METNSPSQLAADGRAAYEGEKYAQAAEAFKAAGQAYQALGNEAAAAEMANNQSVAPLQSGRAEAALQAVAGTAAVFEAHGDLKRHAMAHGNQAAALEAMGRLTEAEEAYHRSAELLSNAGEGELHAHVMQSISALQLRTGKRLEALASMQSSIQGIKRPTFKHRVIQRLLRTPLKLISR